VRGWLEAAPLNSTDAHRVHFSSFGKKNFLTPPRCSAKASGAGRVIAPREPELAPYFKDTPYGAHLDAIISDGLGERSALVGAGLEKGLAPASVCTGRRESHLAGLRSQHRLSDGPLKEEPEVLA
jgi:hypothetical protein